jgi:dolichol kinase
MSAAAVHDLDSLLLVGLLCAAILALAEALRRLGRVDAESTRKLVHVLMGLTVATFPWVFRSSWSVALLCASFAGLLEWGRRERRLLSVHGVARASLGAVYYPAAVALVFVLAHHRPWIYLPSILVMTVSDTVAALTEIDCALAALGTAALAAGLEAVSADGSDNFTVPIGTCFALTLLVATPLLGVVLVWAASLTTACIVVAANAGSRRGRIAPAFGQSRR